MFSLNWKITCGMFKQFSSILRGTCKYMKFKDDLIERIEERRDRERNAISGETVKANFNSLPIPFFMQTEPL